VIGIVLVSHSAALADGLAEMAGQIAGSEVSIVAAGGVQTARSGRPASASSTRSQRRTTGAASSSRRSRKRDPERQGGACDGELDGTRAVLADAPLVEGAIAAAVAASIGQDLDEARGAERSVECRKL